MYSLLKNILFKLDPETAHTIALKSLQLTHALGFKWNKNLKADPISLMGLTFPNKIGLAAGLDKNADYIDALASIGFGFIEIGTVTPKAQAGNPKPRLFRLVEQEAIINRMGFNNKGAEYVVERLKQTRYRGILGINIGKNKDTPNEKAVEDYVYCFKLLSPFASYITINISSPNTQGLRDLQHGELLLNLLSTLKLEQAAAQKYVPLVVKIAPDLNSEALKQTADILLKTKIDAVIATNTTLSREGVQTSIYASEAGGLSGRPLARRSTEVIQTLGEIFKGQVPIIASGGVMDANTARAKLQAGAKLLQVYSGFIYSGPEILAYLSS